MVAVEYAGIYVHHEEFTKLFKICDSLPILKPTISIAESQLKTTLKSLFDTMEDDDFEKKTLNMTHSYYIFFHTNLYFVFVTRSDINDEGKVRAFYLDLKKDLGPVCRGNLKNF
jgi:hypothetical protein